MTRDEMLAMEPGRMLDCEISLRIFGTKEITVIGDYYWIDEPLGKQVPRYSTDISAAWEVVEKMKRAGWGVIVKSWGDDDAMGEDPYLVTFGFEEGPCNFMSFNLPEAICKAALLAVMDV